jgi:hypothetical protein
MRRVYRSLSVPKTRRRAICQRGVWPFRVVRTAAVRTSASPSVAHASHEGLNDRNGSEVIGHIAMRQCTSTSDVIAADTADCGHRSTLVLRQGFSEIQPQEFAL